MAARRTQAEAEARAALLDVESYDVSVDLTADPGTVRSGTVIRFRCRTPGAATHADLVARAVTSVTLNGRRVDPAADLSDGRLRLRDLAASNVLRVDAEFGYSRDGRARDDLSEPVRLVLREQRAIVQQIRTARAAAVTG